MSEPLQNDSQKMMDAVIKRFENPDEIREFEKGKFELLHLPGMTIGRATYKPGWKWSIDVSPLSETKFCNVEHLGMVIEGSATVAFDKKEIITLIPGDVFYVSPKPHDSWVVGDKDYVSIHFLGCRFICNLANNNETVFVYPPAYIISFRSNKSKTFFI